MSWLGLAKLFGHRKAKWRERLGLQRAGARCHLSSLFEASSLIWPNRKLVRIKTHTRGEQKRYCWPRMKTGEVIPRQILVNQGYDVLSASHGEEALAISQK